MLTVTVCVNLPRSIVTDHYLLDQCNPCRVGLANNDVWPREGVQICPWHFPVRKQWPQGSNEVLGPAAPAFPDQDGAAGIWFKRQASSTKPQASSLTAWS